MLASIIAIDLFILGLTYGLKKHKVNEAFRKTEAAELFFS